MDIPRDSPTHRATPELKIRKPSFHFADVPRHWFKDSALATHLANALHLVFPAGERFFIRSVRRYVDRIDDPTLAEQVRGFFGQEARHGLEHERFFEILEAQGYSIRPFLAWYEHLGYDTLEKRVPAELRLAVTVALEHFTATFAEFALSTGVLDRSVHPAMRDLFRWHACEELEHKAIAFDVLKKVNPSYALRMTGLLVGATTFAFFLSSATATLMRQEPKTKRLPSLKEVLRVRREHPLFNIQFVRAFIAYMHPDFHPSQNNNEFMAAKWLANNGNRLNLAS